MGSRLSEFQLSSRGLNLNSHKIIFCISGPKNPQNFEQKNGIRSSMKHQKMAWKN